MPSFVKLGFTYAKFRSENNCASTLSGWEEIFYSMVALIRSCSQLTIHHGARAQQLKRTCSLEQQKQISVQLKTKKKTQLFFRILHALLSVLSPSINKNCFCLLIGHSNKGRSIYATKNLRFSTLPSIWETSIGSRNAQCCVRVLFVLRLALSEVLHTFSKRDIAHEMMHVFATTESRATLHARTLPNRTVVKASKR